MTKKIIACVGRMHAGKDVFCEMIRDFVEPDTVEMIRFSDPLGNCLKRMKTEMPGCANIRMDRSHYQEFSTIIRQEIHPGLLANWVRRKALESEAQWVLIMGMRKMQDLPAMRELPDCLIVSIHAPQELRFQWMQRAVTAKGHQAPERAELLRQDGQECEVDINELFGHSDWHIQNDRDDPGLAHLRQQTEHFLHVLQK